VGISRDPVVLWSLALYGGVQQKIGSICDPVANCQTVLSSYDVEGLPWTRCIARGDETDYPASA
jgi:hypothetical protein